MRALLLLVASVALATGCKKKDPIPEPNPLPVPPGTVPQPKVQPKAPGGVDFKLTVEEFVRQAGTNPDQFAGKVIEVSGKVGGFGTVVNGEREVQLSGSNKFGATVMCAVIDTEPWASILNEQRVKITGTFSYVMFTPGLKGGRITDRGEPIEIKQEPKELLKEAAVDRDATNKKYERKWLRFSGQVTEKRAGEFGGTTVMLSADGAIIECTVRADNVAAFVVGQKLAVAGSVLAVDPNRLQLAPVFPVTKK